MRLEGRAAIIIGRRAAVGDDLGGGHAEGNCTRDTSGIAMSFALISGRVAGEHTVAYAAARGRA